MPTPEQILLQKKLEQQIAEQTGAVPPEMYASQEEISPETAQTMEGMAMQEAPASPPAPEDTTQLAQAEVPAQFQDRTPASIAETAMTPAEAAQAKPQSVSEKMLQKMLEANIKQQERFGDLAYQRYAGRIKSQAESPAVVNYSPLMNWVDQMIGTTYSAGYQPPENPEAVSDKLLQALLNQKGGQLSRLQEQADKNQRFKERIMVEGYNLATKKNDEMASDFQKFTQSAGNVQDAFTPDPTTGKIDVGRIEQATAAFARMLGEVGALSDSDRAKTVSETFKLTMSKILSKIRGTPGDKIDPRDISTAIDAYNTAIKSFKKAASYKKDALLTRFTAKGSPYLGAEWIPDLTTAAEDRIKSLDSFYISYSKEPRTIPEVYAPLKEQALQGTGVTKQKVKKALPSRKEITEEIEKMKSGGR